MNLQRSPKHPLLQNDARVEIERRTAYLALVISISLLCGLMLVDYKWSTLAGRVFPAEQTKEHMPERFFSIISGLLIAGASSGLITLLLGRALRQPRIVAQQKLNTLLCIDGSQPVFVVPCFPSSKMRSRGTDSKAASNFPSRQDVHPTDDLVRSDGVLKTDECWEMSAAFGDIEGTVTLSSLFQHFGEPIPPVAPDSKYAIWTDSSQQSRKECQGLQVTATKAFSETRLTLICLGLFSNSVTMRVLGHPGSPLSLWRHTEKKGRLDTVAWKSIEPPPEYKHHGRPADDGDHNEEHVQAQDVVLFMKVPDRRTSRCIFILGGLTERGTRLAAQMFKNHWRSFESGQFGLRQPDPSFQLQLNHRSQGFFAVYGVDLHPASMKHASPELLNFGLVNEDDCHVLLHDVENSVSSKERERVGQPEGEAEDHSARL